MKHYSPSATRRTEAVSINLPGPGKSIIHTTHAAADICIGKPYGRHHQGKQVMNIRLSINWRACCFVKCDTLIAVLYLPGQHPLSHSCLSLAIFIFPNYVNISSETSRQRAYGARSTTELLVITLNEFRRCFDGQSAYLLNVISRGRGTCSDVTVTSPSRLQLLIANSNDVQGRSLPSIVTHSLITIWPAKDRLSATVTNKPIRFLFD